MMLEDSSRLSDWTIQPPSATILACIPLLAVMVRRVGWAYVLGLLTSHKEVGFDNLFGLVSLILFLSLKFSINTRI